MGKIEFGIKHIFKKRMMLWQYEYLTSEARELVDYTIKENLKCNKELRVRGLFRTKKLLPLKRDLWSITWNNRIELGLAVADDDFFAIFKLIYGITEKQYKQLELYNAFAVQKYVIEEFKQMVEVESNELAHEYTEDEKDAGIEALQDFSYYNTLDSLTKGDLLIQDEWLMLPYSKIFRKMCLDKVRFDINENLKENAKRKANTNNN